MRGGTIPDEARVDVTGRPRAPRILDAQRARHVFLLLLLVFLFGAPPPTSAQASDPAQLGSNVKALLDRVRNFNPELAAAALDSEEAPAKIVPAGALDDPMINLTRDQGFRQTIFSVSQDFPLWGKRTLREDVARATATSAKGRERSVAVELEERVKVTFAQYYLAHRAITLTHDIHALPHTVTASVQERYARGLGSQADAIKAQLDLIRIDPELSALERDEQIAKAKINALLARPAGMPLADPTKLRALPRKPLLLPELLARAKAENPTLAMNRADIAAADGEQMLVDKSYYPDVTVSVGGSDLPGMSPRLVAGVGIKIPLQWGVRDAQQHAAIAKKGAAQLRLDAMTLQIESDLVGALANLARAQRTAALLTTSVTPQSEAAYRSALAAYQNGKGLLAPVFEAAHEKFDVQLELLRVRMDEQTALAALEKLVGGTL
jgi:outer membrane protein, heavy metal efflux system